MVTPTPTSNADLDQGDRRSKILTALAVALALLVGALGWYLGQDATNSANKEASAKAQTFSLAQQVAAACASKDILTDMSTLCDKAKIIAKEGPAGAAGPPGDQGAQGATGATGADGLIGPIGIQGANGAQGVQGTQGIIGLTGITGSNGDAGAQGPAGAKGDTGAPGAPSGIKGDPGIQGIQGNPGSAYPFEFTFTVKGETIVCVFPAAATPGVCTPKIAS